MKRKILIALSSLLALFVAGAAVASLYVHNTTAELSRLVQLHRIENLRRALIISIQTVQSDVYTVRTSMSPRLDSIIHHVNELDGDASACTGCHHSPEVTRQLENIQARIQDYQAALSYYITASANVERIERIQLEAAAIGNEILYLTESMSLTASNRLGERTTRAMADIDQVKTILLATILLAFALSIAISLKLARSITRPVRELLTATDRIASGSLGHKITYEDKTEFGVLARNFNIMSDALRDGYEKLKASNEELGQEVASRIKTETALRESEEKYRTLVESASDAIIVADAETGVIVDANRQAEKLLGRGAGEIIGLHQYELHPVEESERYGALFRGNLNAGTGISEDVYVLNKDGRRIPVSISAGAAEFHGRQVIQSIYRDMTERVNLENQLRHAQKMEALGTLSAGIAHEYFNILTAIMGCAEFLAEEVPKGGDLERYVRIIQQSVERAKRISQNLLTYSRKEEIDSEHLNVNELVEHIRLLLEHLRVRDIKFEFSASEEGLTLMADRGQMEQVLMNLATNAIDAMPEGGTLSVSAGSVEFREEFVAGEAHIRPGRYVLISVADTGTGMTREQQGRVFEPFYTTKDVGKGTGLGMSITYGIVRSHKGYISMDSEVGKGTTFNVYLPADRGAV